MATGAQAEQPLDPLPIKVIRSRRRTKSSAARIVGDVIEVRIPATMSAADERRVSASLAARVESKRAVQLAPVDLGQRARKLATVYDLPVPKQIRWSTNQTQIWGSCSYEMGEIRISSRLVRVPNYVLDWVILHELTHLVESDHGPEFHRLVNRYPKAERAEGYLEAMANGVG